MPVVDVVLPSHEQEVYPTISLDENCREFEFQRDRNFYVNLRQNYWALKLKFIRGRSYEAYKTKKHTKEQKEEAKADEEATAKEEQDAPDPIVTYVKKHLAVNFFQC